MVGSRSSSNPNKLGTEDAKCIQSKSERIFAKACLRQNLGFHTEICEFREQRILKIGLFNGVKKLFKLNQTWNGVSLVYVECKTKKNFCYTLPATKVRFTYRNLRILRITIFKNMSFSLGQKFVQIEPNME